MKTSRRNRRLALRFPVEAGLDRIIDWDHPLLKAVTGPDPAARLLAAWRREPGYRYFFDRADLAALLRDIPPHAWKEYEAVLDHLRVWRRGGTPAGRNPVPVKRGRPQWFCFTKRNKEFVCAVSRFGWISGAAAAARRSGDRASAEAVFAIIDDWLRACPAPVALIEWKIRPWRYWYHPWSPLNTALRVKGWMLALHLLWDSPALTPERFGRYVRAIRQHLVFCGRVSPRLDPSARGNHFLMESEGLLYSALFPWLRESAAARGAALANLERCIDRQILADGVHRESAPGYHRGCMQWFALPFILARLNGWPVQAGCARRIGRMLEFGLQVVTPDGTVSKSGDNSAARDGWVSEQLLARVTGRKLPVKVPPASGLLAFIRNIPAAGRAGRARFPLARHFRDGGFAVARSSWRPDASHLLMKLDGYGGGHSHGDFLGFNFVWRGRMVVDELGTWAYDDDRKSVGCKAAAAHNVLLLGARELLQMGEGFDYWLERKPAVRLRRLFCQPEKDGRMRAGGRAVWPDGAWWQRKVEFDPARGLRLIDEFSAPEPEPVRLQFYVPGAKVARESKLAFRTADAGQPNVRIAIAGDLPLAGRATPTEVFQAFFVARAATLLVFAAPPARRGRIETVIEGV